MQREDQVKKRTTIYISRDVLEFLKIRSAKGGGSVSQQLEDLASQLMPEVLTEEDIRQQEHRHARGYEAHPVGEDEFSAFYEEQDPGSP